MADRVNLQSVFDLIRERIADGDPARSYVARLAGQGRDAVLKKIGEECVEVVLAAKNGERAAAIHELADLQFHLLVWMALEDIHPADLERELGARFGRGGLGKVPGASTAP